MSPSAVWNTYTQDPGAQPPAVFPNHGMQIFSLFIHITGLSVLTYCVARRTSNEEWSFRGISSMPWPRMCIILVFVDSWLFVFSSSLLIFGAGLSFSLLTCSLGIFSCILLYLGSKLLVYAFLIEKVYIVWSSHGTTGAKTRWETPIWRICMALLAPILGILALLIWGRIADLRGDRACVIGLNRIASTTLLAYDLFLTVFLTALFVWPLWRSQVSKKLRQVASRTLIASSAALTTSAINIAVLTAMHGKQLGWVCLSSCGTDVTLNAIVLYWVTIGSGRGETNTPAGQHPSSGGGTFDGTSKDHRFSARVPPLPSPRGDMPTSSVHQVEHVIERAHRDRATHFADPPKARAKSGVVTINDMRRSVGGNQNIFSKFADKVKNIAGGRERAEPEEHTMSVQVTVTTERQLEEHDIIGHEGKYAPSTSSTEMSKVEDMDVKH